MSPIQQLGASELRSLWDREPCLQVCDVRTPWEWQTARIEGSRLLDQAWLEELLALPPETPIAFVCHHGIRSQAAAQHFAAHGFSQLYNLAGGIDAWSAEVDPAVPRY